MNKQDLIDKVISEFGGVFSGKLPEKFNHELDIRITTSAEGKSTIHATAVGASFSEDEFNQRARELASSNQPTKPTLSLKTFKDTGFSFTVKKINNDMFCAKISEDEKYARVFLDKEQALKVASWILENCK